MMFWPCIPLPYHPDTTFQEYYDDALIANRHYGDIMWNWTNFQFDCWKSNYMNFGRFIFHTNTLASEPELLFRYTRRHWQKPFMAIAAQNLTHWHMLNLVLLEDLKLKYHLHPKSSITPH